MNASLLILHVVVGLGIAAHDVPKMVCWFGGGPVNGIGGYGKDSNEFGLF